MYAIRSYYGPRLSARARQPGAPSRVVAPGPVGSLHDHELMTAVLEDPALVDQPVRTVMGPSFPSVNIDSQIDDVVRLMMKKKSYNFV